MTSRRPLSKLAFAWAPAALLAMIAACGPRTEPYATTSNPEPDEFATSVPLGTTAYSHDSLAVLLADLTLVTEWGDKIDILNRYEPPISVGIVGGGYDTYLPFLDNLLADLTKNTGIQIRRSEAPHDLLIRFVPGPDWTPLQDNQCIIINGQPDLATFLNSEENYAKPVLTKSGRMRQSVFIPNTNTPNEIRECLIEETLQALGPANDIYGLGATIFNDDDAHSWPTRMDYLMLRVLYDPEMPAKAARTDMIDAARKILRRVNPEGNGAPDLPPHRQEEFMAWRGRIHQMNRLLRDEFEDHAAAKGLAEVIVEEAEEKAPLSAYHCEAVTNAGWMLRQSNDADAMAVLETARTICATAHGDQDIRIAKLRQQQALLALDEKQYAESLRRSAGLVEIFKAHGQDDEVATTYALRWAAMSWLDHPDRDKTHDQALRWSAYAFGNDNEIVQEWRGY
ncbi:MAG: DUF2927 domain-containing protein [Pseudomonadota bacterium]